MRKILDSLKRKYGPLPLWAWAAIAGGALAVWFRVRGGGGREAAAIAEPAIAYGGEADYGDTGTGLGPLGAVDAVPAEAGGAGEYFPDNKLREATMDLVDQLRGATEDVSAARGAPAVEPGGETYVDPETAAPVASSSGVRWGGQTFTTKRGIAAHLRTRGVSWKRWAKNHPAAARRLLGPPPKPQPQPKPKPTTKPSSRTPARGSAKPGQGQGGARPRTPPKAKAAPPARPRKPAPRQATPTPKRKKAGGGRKR